MTQKKKSFVLYNDMSSVFDLLSIEERGILITAIFEYVQYGDTIITAESDRATIAFQCIKNTLDRDRESYFAKCEAYSANGKKGGRPPKQWLSEKAKKADSDSVSDNDSVNVSDSDSDSVNVSDSDSDSDSVNVSDSDSDNIPRVSDACAPRPNKNDKKYLVEKETPRVKSQKARKAEEWFEARLRKTFGDDA